MYIAVKRIKIFHISTIFSPIKWDVCNISKNTFIGSSRNTVAHWLLVNWRMQTCLYGPISVCKSIETANTSPRRCCSIYWCQLTPTVASNSTLIDERWIWKVYEVSKPEPMHILSRHVFWGTEGNHENLRHNNRCLGRDSNRNPPEYESSSLPLLQPFRCGILFIRQLVYS